MPVAVRRMPVPHLGRQYWDEEWGEIRALDKGNKYASPEERIFWNKLILSTVGLGKTTLMYGQLLSPSLLPKFHLLRCGGIGVLPFRSFQINTSPLTFRLYEGEFCVTTTLRGLPRRLKLNTRTFSDLSFESLLCNLNRTDLTSRRPFGLLSTEKTRKEWKQKARNESSKTC